jgi:hypothetical protein
MHKFTVWNDAEKAHYRRISKSEARKLWLDSKPFVVCASNLQPFGWSSFGMHVDPSKYADETTFRSTGDPSDKTDYYAKGEYVPYDLEALVSNYESYNCVSKETGRYASFYVKLPMISNAELAANLPTDQAQFLGLA